MDAKQVNNMHYTPDWTSLDNRLIPSCFQGDKFDFFINLEVELDINKKEQKIDLFQIH